MKLKNITNYFVCVVDVQGVVQKRIVRGSDSPTFVEGDSLEKYVTDDSIKQVQDCLKTINEFGISKGYPIQFINQGSIIDLIMGGYFKNNDIVLVGISKVNPMSEMILDLFQIGLDVVIRKYNEESEFHHVLEKFSALQNELIKTQRSLEKMNLKYKKLAHQDELTGAYNRHYFYETISDEIACAIKRDYALTFVQLDINQFKKINDQFGHLVGDQVLQKVVEVCQRHLKEEIDKVYRFGGDEFILLVHDTVNDQIKKLTELINQDLFKHKPSISVSFGYMELSAAQLKEGILMEEVYRKIDQRLYRNKKLYQVSI